MSSLRSKLKSAFTREKNTATNKDTNPSNSDYSDLGGYPSAPVYGDNGPIRSSNRFPTPTQPPRVGTAGERFPASPVYDTRYINTGPNFALSPYGVQSSYSNAEHPEALSYRAQPQPNRYISERPTQNTVLVRRYHENILQPQVSHSQSQYRETFTNSHAPYLGTNTSGFGSRENQHDIPYALHEPPGAHDQRRYFHPTRTTERNIDAPPQSHERVVPQVVVIPDDESLSDGDDESSELIFLVKTEDGRYLPLTLGNGSNLSRVPSPAPPFPSERQHGQRRLIYSISDSDSSSDSVNITRKTGPVQPRFGMSREEWNQNSGVQHDDDEGVASSSTPFERNASELNLNRRYDYLPLSMVPFWYQKNVTPAPIDSRQYLCATCRHIDIKSLFNQEEVDATPSLRDYVVLGTLESIITKQGCGLCTLVSAMIAFDTGIGLPRDMPESEKKETQKIRILAKWAEVYYLCPIRFKTTYREPALYIRSGTEIAETAADSILRRPRRSMALSPLHNSAPNHGRILRNPGQIDFQWIRQCMDLCDERDVGKLDYMHKVGVRVIDVEDLRIVEIDHGERYVTLSYTWGEVDTLKLQKHNLNLFQEHGFASMWEDIPRTIRDSIKLVQEIGERYLWVDALCIVQDDGVDLMAHITEMGDIYRNSILTICVCCGEDANYGLPGILPDTRETRQICGLVGEVPLGNALQGAEDIEGAKWDTRGWTLQEKALSQRKLLISNTYVQWWCWHTSTTEDQNCRHCWWDPGTKHRGMYFFKTEHDMVVSKLPRNCNLDTYAFMVSDYTSRNLTKDSDAELAVRGVFRKIEGLFRGTFRAYIPDTELSAALLWVPIGGSRRRTDGTHTPIFPSWSWLGWVGHVSYPWLIERAFPMSEMGSPLLWRNARTDAEPAERWFTGVDYRMVSPSSRRSGWTINKDDNGWTWTENDGESRLYIHPVIDSYYYRFQHFDGEPRYLQFRTLSARLLVEPLVRIRKENHDHIHKVHYVRLLNAQSFCIGYMHVPDPEETDSTSMSKFSGQAEFLVLSRASTNSDATIGEELLSSVPLEELHSVYSLAHMISGMEKLRPLDEHDTDRQHEDGKAYFDTRLYDATTPWGLFNVMMIERANGKAFRVAIGRVHVAAFMEAKPVYKEVTLE